VPQVNRQGLRTKPGNRTQENGKNYLRIKDLQFQAQWALLAIAAPIFVWVLGVDDFRLKHHRSPELVEGCLSARRASTGSALRFLLESMSSDFRAMTLFGNAPHQEPFD
jgi:hypothetical protein